MQSPTIPPNLRHLHQAPRARDEFLRFRDAAGGASIFLSVIAHAPSYLRHNPIENPWERYLPRGDALCNATLTGPRRAH